MTRFATLILLAGVLAILVWPAIVGPPRGEHIVFDPALAVNGLTLVAVGFYTYLTYGLLRHSQQAAEKERQRRRDALATALLVELVTIEDRLRFLYSEPIDEYSAALEHPVLRNALRNVDLFDKDISYAIVRFSQNLSRAAKTAENTLKLGAREGMRFRSSIHEQNQIVFSLELLARLQSLLRPLAPEIASEWLTFPHERGEALPLPPSAFADIPERLYGETVAAPVPTGSADSSNEDA